MQCAPESRPPPIGDPDRGRARPRPRWRLRETKASAVRHHAVSALLTDDGSHRPGAVRGVHHRRHRPCRPCRGWRLSSACARS
eukprot:8286493-Alexandrium_andersonii.AAC.1